MIFSQSFIQTISTPQQQYLFQYVCVHVCVCVCVCVL